MVPEDFGGGGGAAGSGAGEGEGAAGGAGVTSARARTVSREVELFQREVSSRTFGVFVLCDRPCSAWVCVSCGKIGARVPTQVSA